MRRSWQRMPGRKGRELFGLRTGLTRGSISLHKGRLAGREQNERKICGRAVRARHLDFGAGIQPADDGCSKRRSEVVARRAARSGALQGHAQGARPVRRPAAGHRPQSGRGRLDRGAAAQLWLRPRADQIRLQFARAVARSADRGTSSWHAGRQRRDRHGTRRRADQGHDAAGRPQQQSGGADRSNTARPQRGTLDPRAARGSLLHQGRLNAAGRDVYRGRSHGWTRLRGGDR